MEHRPLKSDSAIQALAQSVPPGGIGEGALRPAHRGGAQLQPDVRPWRYLRPARRLFHFGGDLESKNTALGPRKKDFVAAAGVLPGVGLSQRGGGVLQEEPQPSFAGNPPGCRVGRLNPTATRGRMGNRSPSRAFRSISGNTHVTCPKAGRVGRRHRRISTDNGSRRSAGRQAQPLRRLRWLSLVAGNLAIPTRRISPRSRAPWKHSCRPHLGLQRAPGGNA